MVATRSCPQRSQARRAREELAAAHGVKVVVQGAGLAHPAAAKALTAALKRRRVAVVVAAAGYRARMSGEVIPVPGVVNRWRR